MSFWRQSTYFHWNTSFLVCSNSPAGLFDSDKIPDYRISASTYYGNGYQPYNARLNQALYGWAPSSYNKSNSWLRIDLGNAFIICSIATQGTNYFYSEWIKKYKLNLSMGSLTWQNYQENGTSKVRIIFVLSHGNLAKVKWFLKVLLHCAIFSATCLATPFATQVSGELHSVTGVVSQLFCCMERCTK